MSILLLHFLINTFLQAVVSSGSHGGGGHGDHGDQPFSEVMIYQVSFSLVWTFQYQTHPIIVVILLNAGLSNFYQQKA